ncbi:hypothetical protein HPPN135_01160 [Helicobacter pylori Puno135]|nr:hypothetical protein HPPN135_01160 [Helicobacter pylori Puno135]
MCLLIKLSLKKGACLKRLKAFLKLDALERAYLLQSLSSYKTNQNPIFVIIKERFFKDYHSFLIK